MASSSTADIALAAAKDQFTDIEEALARLIRVNYAPDARSRGAASDRSAEAPISPSFEGTLDPAGHQVAHGARGQRSRRKRGVLARVTLAVCLGISAIWAWRSAGNPAPAQTTALPAIETSVPPPAQAASMAQGLTTAENEQGGAPDEPPQSDTTARDLAALRQTVAQLAAGQEQLTRELAKLQAEKPQADKPSAEKPDEQVLARVSAAPAPPLAAPVRKPAVKTRTSPQAARRLSASIISPPLQPAPQTPPQAQLSALPLPRPPMPVPLP
jgi:hypothetical protein